MSDRLLGFCALIFAGLMAWFGHDLQAPFAYEPVGPRAFPMLIALIIALCGAWLLYKNWNKPRRGEAIDWPRLMLMVVYIFIYALLFETLGFIIATAIITVVIGRLFGGPWIKMTIAGIVMGVLFFLLFDRALDVVLPLGPLEFLS
ncbi:tripartite tricarboxylate transporter TctB family protein [Castellaniella sp.]|uniref:tripartite tricarboxylate transporter TctB family protein n=1 Tax=Castellaniella sp. TaxID=1955812 RepID=UPI002AFF28FF|nr:tripartite tricarboxylate transporter TctB family protein [Castellaniella sp.]